ncbi:DUF6624 domain-containing protein [Rhodanobacter ginsengiterrae]|uniref:DUF6624 domain-containing protein n=1 Tax=Rhodanobacter ginsengiterrae TaxID=2008451 RepID=UPI003CE92EDE
MFVLLLLGSMALAQARAGDMDAAKLAQHCPGFAAWQSAHPELSEKNRAKPVDSTRPTDPHLRQQLLAMSKADEAVRDAWNKAGMKTGQGKDPTFMRVMAVDADNLRQLKPIVERNGFPTPSRVGADGVDAAFMLVQHADADPAFQSRVLPQLEALAKQRVVSGQQVAMLTDRVLRNEDSPQRYGTQFVSDDKSAAMKLQPIEDVEHVDARRRDMGLPPLADYACILSAVYGKPFTLKP